MIDSMIERCLMNTDRTKFHEYGYFVVQNFLSDEELRTYMDVCRYHAGTNVSDMDDHYYLNSNGSLNKIQAACWIEPEFRKLASHPVLLENAQYILGELPDIYISKFFPGPPGGHTTGLHQDSFYFDTVDTNDIVTCAIYLEDTDIENGCLMIVPDTHTESIMPHDVKADLPWLYWIDPSKFHTVVNLELKAPYAVFFHVNIVHGAYKNTSSDRTRYSFAWEYIKQSVDSPRGHGRNTLMDYWCDRQEPL